MFFKAHWIRGKTCTLYLTTVRNSVEATLLQHALEAEGIKSFVTNVHTGTSRTCTVIESKQIEWETRTKNELVALADYCKTCKPTKRR